MPAGTYALTAVATDNAARRRRRRGVGHRDPRTAAAAPLSRRLGARRYRRGAVAGDATLPSGTFTRDGAGADVWGTADAFHYAYRTLNGDGTIVARVTSIQNVHAWIKAGVMIRESLSPSRRRRSCWRLAVQGRAVPAPDQRGNDQRQHAGSSRPRRAGSSWSDRQPLQRLRVGRRRDLDAGRHDTIAMGATVSSAWRSRATPPARGHLHVRQRQSSSRLGGSQAIGSSSGRRTA